MRFVRCVVSHSQNRIIAVFEQDVPFLKGGSCEIVGEECETYDLGAVEDQAWTDAEGKPCSLTRHVLEKLESGNAGIVRLHDAPCTIEGIRARLRARGPAGLPVKLRAWLAATLPADQVRQLGIARGIPVGTLKACEAIRAARDPAGGSKVPYFERITHAQAVRRSEGELRKRKAKEARQAAVATAAAEAWEEMRGTVARQEELDAG